MKISVSKISTIAFYGLIVWLIYTDINKPKHEVYNTPSEMHNPTVTKSEVLYSEPQLLQQNDLMMNIVANPTFSLEDFVTIGINRDNVSLKDIQVYRNDPYIRSVFTDEFGNIDEMSLQSFYHRATEWMKKLRNDEVQCNLEPSFHRDNIFAPSEQRRQGHDYEQYIITNDHK